MNKNLDQRFGEALRALRERSGKTQEDFTATGRTYLSELERGLKTPTLETIVHLATDLGVSPSLLVELATANDPAAQQAGKGRLSSAMSEGLSLAVSHRSEAAAARFNESSVLATVESTIAAAGIELPHFLAETALVAFRNSPGRNPRSRRQKLGFVIADKQDSSKFVYAMDGGVAWSFSAEDVRRAAVRANITLELADDVLGMNGIPFYELLGTRNLGSFVGAVFAYSLRQEMPDRLMVNGHQDGYPDLCALTKAGKKYIDKIKAAGLETAKNSWAFYPEGGIEVKTTCGSVPTASQKRKKPQIGDMRTPVLTGADWKAHHRETNRLLGLFWDFIDEVPTVLALFFRNDLTEADWGEVIVPKAEEAPEQVVAVQEGLFDESTAAVTIEGPLQKAEPKKKKKPGRTTSVSIMPAPAVKKMGKCWVILPTDPELLAGISKRTIFDLGLADIEPLTSRLPAEMRAVLEKLDKEKHQSLVRQAATEARKAAAANRPSRTRRRRK